LHSGFEGQGNAMLWSEVFLTSNVDGVVKSREFSIKLVGWAIAHHNWRAIAHPTLFINIRRLFTSSSTSNGDNAGCVIPSSAWAFREFVGWVEHSVTHHEQPAPSARV